MKIRNGFVSNSSSASFVVVWKLPLQYNDVGEFICNIFNVNYDKEKHVLKTEFRKDYCEDEDLAIKALDNTQHVSDNIYQTTAFTGMMNTISDFETQFLSFIAALVVNKVEIVSADIDNDN